ncbi:MAG: hypothetical protein EOP04_20690 [Proteobacteria bacterium]|nr:MAG: hypothetical protein EOP04_20690 [Pseudomonadota bacterium]
MPTDPAYNIFQSIRRRDDFFPVTDIELAFLNSKIKTIPQNLNETYVFRHGLAKRLGHVTPSKSSLGDLYPAYEPLSLDVWKSVLRQGLESSVSTFGEDAKGLANLPVLDIFAKIETIMNRQNGLNIIQAKGYVSNLTKSSDENVKMSEQLTISRTEMKIFSDLIYRAVLLAKATELNPFSILPELEEKIGESCEDYAKYSLAVQNKRDEIILNYTLSDENDARPALSFAINRAPIREWLTDSTKKELKNGESPVVLDRSIGCGKDWSTDFCPLLWTSTRSSRFKSLNVRVIDVFNVSQPVWERIIDRPARSVEIVSASAFRDLLRNGFFRTQGIDPTLEIEGVFESNGREGRTLLFSHKLTRKEGPLDDLVIDCSQNIHDDKSEFECDLGLQARGFSISAGYCEKYSAPSPTEKSAARALTRPLSRQIPPGFALLIKQ